MTRSSHTRIGDYIVLHTLGTGSTGKVKLARHVVTDKLVALKVVRNNLLETNPHMYEKVRREIAVLKLIAASCPTPHPNSPSSLNTAAAENSKSSLIPQIGLMQLQDVYRFDNAVVLILEYCPRGELFDLLLEQGCLPFDVVLDYFQQLVFALRFCHRRGICHRDLKPENILLADDGRLKLADFGMSTLLHPGAFQQTSCGSPQYCAPEVLLGDLYDGAAADVWSLGVILFTMTTGGLPFDDDNFQRLYAKIQSAAYYMPPEVPEPLADVIRSMLVADPAQRTTLPDLVCSPWFKSHPPRHDVYIEEETALDDLSSDAAATGAGGKLSPILEADTPVLKHLADLGLGDVHTIRRRLESGRPCRDRQLYLDLFAFCSRIRAYRDNDVSDESDSSMTRGNSAASLDGLFAPSKQPAVLHVPQSDPRLQTIADTAISDAKTQAFVPTWADANVAVVGAAQRESESPPHLVDILSR